MSNSDTSHDRRRAGRVFDDSPHICPPLDNLSLFLALLILHSPIILFDFHFLVLLCVRRRVDAVLRFYFDSSHSFSRCSHWFRQVLVHICYIKLLILVVWSEHSTCTSARRHSSRILELSDIGWTYRSRHVILSSFPFSEVLPVNSVSKINTIVSRA